jgi:cytochrome P450
MCAYFRTLARAGAAAPRDDLVSLMLAAEDSGAMLSEDEVVSNCVLLLFAGHETTTNLLGNGLLHLLQRPAQLQRVRAHPALLPRAVDELLRYDTPVAGTIRVVGEDTTLGGHRLAAGDLLAAFMASANRDGAHVERPDELDVTRESPRHLSFGHGIHFCLGAALARLEVQLALRTLLGRYHVELLGDAPDWKPQIFFRGLKRLDLRLRPIATVR